MKKYDVKLVGILWTLIVHLIAGIVFISLQLKSIQKEATGEIQMEFVAAEEPPVKEKPVEIKGTTIESILKDDEEMQNIARNMANKTEEKINAADYIDKVKEELIKSGKLGIDNYIDEKKRLNENKTDNNSISDTSSVKKKESGQPDESQKMASNFKGPTRIYYDLEKRTHIYLPIPIYKCQGSGKVVLSIEVNQKGDVEKAIIIANESTTSDECLIETAIETALISRFNPDANSPKIQKGTLSYQFVAQ
jgi:hypothetical protein